MGLVLVPVGVTRAVVALVAGLQTLVAVGIAAAVAGLVSLVGGLVTLRRVHAKEKAQGSFTGPGTSTAAVLRDLIRW